MNRRCVLWLSLLVSGAFTACGGSEEPVAAPAQLAHGMAKGADLSRCKVAGAKNRKLVLARGLGAPDTNIQRVFEFDPDSKQAVRSLRCRMVDTNWDGITDVIRGYTDKGEPLEEQADTDYDGRIDTWLRFSRGRVIREVQDRNRDGKPDENRIYSGGKLSRIQRDRNGDGRLDTWEVYDGDRLHRVGVDLDGDQRVDRWYRDEELKRRERQAEAARAVSAPGPADSAEPGNEAESGAQPAPSAASSTTPPKTPPAAAPAASTPSSNNAASTNAAASTVAPSPPAKTQPAPSSPTPSPKAAQAKQP